MNMSGYHIGDVTRMLDISADTLRYYEKIAVLKRIARNGSGLRVYDDKDISRLKFIRRAQTMNFSLAEIGSLLKMRENPQRARRSVRELTQQKFDEIEIALASLKTLRDEMQLLLNLCAGSKDGCPIIENIDKGDSSPKRRRRRTNNA